MAEGGRKYPPVIDANEIIKRAGGFDGLTKIAMAKAEELKDETDTHPKDREVEKVKRTDDEMLSTIDNIIESFNKQDLSPLNDYFDYVDNSDKESGSRIIQGVTEKCIQQIIDDYVHGNEKAKLVDCEACRGEPVMVAISSCLLYRMICNKVVVRKLLDRSTETFPAIATHLAHKVPKIRFQGIRIANYTLLHVKQEYLDKACDCQIFSQVVKHCMDPENELKISIRDACQLLQFSMEEGSQKTRRHLLLEIKVINYLGRLHSDNCDIPRIKHDKSLQSTIQSAIQLIGLHMGHVDPRMPIIKNLPAFGKSNFLMIRELLNTKCSSPTCSTYEDDEWSFKSCARCRICRYCSRTCQRSHWKTEHKSLCQPDESSQRDSTHRTLHQVALTHPFFTSDEKCDNRLEQPSVD